MLQDQTHALDIVARIAPVALGIEIAKFEHVRLAQMNLCDRVGYLAGHKFATAQGRFVIEEDAARPENVKALAIVHRQPVRIELRHAVRATRIERRIFGLRNCLHLTEHLGRRGLVEADVAVDRTDRLQKVGSSKTGDHTRRNRLVERYAYEALRSKVIDLGRLRRLEQANCRTHVRQIIFDQLQRRVILDAQFLNAPKIDRTGAAIGTVDGITTAEQVLRQICAILAADSRDNGAFSHSASFRPRLWAIAIMNVDLERSSDFESRYRSP